MKVKDLADLLSKLNPEATVVVHRDAFNYGYGEISTIKVGLFVETDYGNDFFVEQRLVVNPKEVTAICIYPDDSEDKTEKLNDKAD